MITEPHPRQRQDFELKLVAATPVHVGGSGPDSVTDLPLATDGQGRLMIPGSSWAGVLRALTRQHLTEDVDDLFGHQDVNGSEDDGHASRLFLADTQIGPDVRPELRTGVAIDRRTGAASDRLVFDRFVLPVGTGLVLRLRHEGPRTDAPRQLVALVRALGLRLGAASSRGLGRLTCTQASVRTVDLGSRASLLGTLADPDVEPELVEAAPDVDELVPRIELTWRALRPVVVGGPSPGESADLVPLLTRAADGSGLVPVLPGSSVKGVLRAAVERVLCTILDRDDAAAECPGFEVLFGSVGRAGALSVPDTGALVEPVPEQDWLGYLGGKPTSAGWARERTHVAIDRWTGGAAESRLFTVQETEGVAWAPIRLELDPHRLAAVPAGHRKAAVLMLGVAVGLLQDGWVGVGHGTTRGLGEIMVTGVQLIGGPACGVPDFTGTDWWEWLREVGAGFWPEGVLE